MTQPVSTQPVSTLPVSTQPVSTLPVTELSFPSTAAPFADVLSGLVRLLAGLLRLEPQQIDPDQTFRTFGFDSLLSVEYVAVVNAHHGTSIEASALVDHPTPTAFARYVAGERPRETGPVTASSVTARDPMHAPVPTPPPGPQGLPVLDVLREELAHILYCDPWDIDTKAPFYALGVDSTRGTEFVAVLNRVYGLREYAVTLYGHPNLTALADHVTSLLPVDADVRAAGTAPAG
ncbi:acyl carrier protein [Streptomyces sp. NPDC021093]|uniref:acyl carrier protein n=1 Tax=Streptomyces sp. NPDC021093 TaxID=3365112 RepID=UPI0037AC623E